jgi:hypothetical protein
VATTPGSSNYGAGTPSASGGPSPATGSPSSSPTSSTPSSTPGSSGGAQQSLRMWDQCGGMGGNCQNYQCADGAYAR